MNEQAKTYEVKDTDQEKYTIKANRYTVSASGLQFFMNSHVVGWFARWANFRVVKNT